MIAKLRRCPKCKRITDRFECCYVKGHPLIPQTDDYTATVPCDVVAVTDVVDAMWRAMPVATKEEAADLIAARLAALDDHGTPAESQEHAPIEGEL